MAAVQVESVGRAERLRMPKSLCLGKASYCLLNEKFRWSKNFEVFTIAEILAKLLASRESVWTNNKFFFSKFNLKCFVVLENYAKNLQLLTKDDKGYELIEFVN